VELESVLVHTSSVLKLSSGDDGHESLFRCETKVVERSAPGYRIAWRGSVRARGVSAHHGMDAAISFFYGVFSEPPQTKSSTSSSASSRSFPLTQG
jgi:hypothetical protein